MAGEHGSFRHEEELKDNAPSHTLPQSPLSLSSNELGETAALFHLAESNKPVEPSIERWAQFNEHVIARAVESLHHRPSFRQRRQTLFDRFVASDSRLKQHLRVIVGILLLVAFGVLAVWLYGTSSGQK